MGVSFAFVLRNFTLLSLHGKFTEFLVKINKKYARTVRIQFHAKRELSLKLKEKQYVKDCK